MIKDTHEQYVIKLSGQSVHVINRTLLDIQVDAQGLGGKPRLIQIAVIDINSQHPAGSASLHLDGIEAAVAANVENRGPAQIEGNGVGNLPPFDAGKIAQKMVGRRGHAVQVEVVEPLTELRDSPRQMRYCVIAGHIRC